MHSPYRLLAGCDRPPNWCECHHILHWAGDGSFEVDTADPTSRLPSCDVDCGLLARHSPTHRSNQRPTAQKDDVWGWELVM
ncbi:MAG TPA: hypothetical protein VK908_04155 [Jiangellales bacterium]|nr:hypothetical protein [Jiangellales bacterium]